MTPKAPCPATWSARMAICGSQRRPNRNSVNGTLVKNWKASNTRENDDAERDEDREKRRKHHEQRDGQLDTMPCPVARSDDLKSEERADRRCDCDSGGHEVGGDALQGLLVGCSGFNFRRRLLEKVSGGNLSDLAHEN